MITVIASFLSCMSTECQLVGGSPTWAKQMNRPIGKETENHVSFLEMKLSRTSYTIIKTKCYRKPMHSKCFSKF